MTCSLCPNPARKSGRYCKAHHAAKMREFRKKTPLTTEQRKKMNCRSYANVYQRRGKLVARPCEKCGKPAQKHHPHYDKPLDVRWLCREHHEEHHAQERMAA